MEKSTTRLRAAQGASVSKSASAKEDVKTPQKPVKANDKVAMDKLAQDVRDQLLKDAETGVKTENKTKYMFILTGKTANIEFVIESKDAEKRLEQFLIANISNRLTKIFSLKYARNFSKSEQIQLTFKAHGKILNSAKIASTIGLTLKAGKSQFEQNEDTKQNPFTVKITEMVQAGLLLIDETDYSL